MLGVLSNMQLFLQYETHQMMAKKRELSEAEDAY